MLPRLEAQRQIDAIVAAQLAQPVSGADGFKVRQELARREDILARLQSTARGEAPPEPKKANPEDLAGMGIAVRSEQGPEPVISDLAAWLGNGSSEPSQERLSDG